MDENLNTGNPGAAAPNQPQQNAYPYQPQQGGYPTQPQQFTYPTQPQQNAYPNQPRQGGYPTQAPQNPYPNQPQQVGYQYQQTNNAGAYQNQQPGAYPYAQQNAYGYQQPGNQYQQPYAAAGPMPSQGAYLALVIIGFVLGILWGALSIGPYNKMKDAIAANDSVTAQENAKKIRIFFFIGLGINILIIIGQIAQAS